MNYVRGNAWRICPLPSLITKKRRLSTNRYYDKAIFVFLCMENQKIDFGHDFDVDGQECKDGRSRTWMLLLYPDNPEHLAVIEEKLSELDWNFAGRLHDQDGVKDHHHVVVLFKDGRKNADVAADLGIEKRWLRAWDRQKKAFRYLCHRDNPEKFQYSVEGIYGTLAEKAVGACSKGNEMSEVQSVKEITKMLRDIDGFVTYDFFLNLVSDAQLYPVFRRMGHLAVKLIEQHNQEVQRQLDLEYARKVGFVADRATFERFVRYESQGINFDEMITRLNRQGYKFPETPME